jgi:hypothetical protein
MKCHMKKEVSLQHPVYAPPRAESAALTVLQPSAFTHSVEALPSTAAPSCNAGAFLVRF